MQPLLALIGLFNNRFNATTHFPIKPDTLYQPNLYFLQLGGKRIRPALCLMGNELFNTINNDAYEVAAAIELFHNFTLIHDDIMDVAPLRRGMPTVPAKYGNNTAILSGDVMLVAAYEKINKIDTKYIHTILKIFNKTAQQVCEGQQLDMDFEKKKEVTLPDYLEMITLKTSVLLAASLQMGAVLGGASEANANLLYQFGINIGLAFQIQDDYLDAFGEPEKFGKKIGGDIIANKKTFLTIHALETANPQQKEKLEFLLTTTNDSQEKVEEVVQIFKECKVDEWANSLKQKYVAEAYKSLEAVAVLNNRKQALKDVAVYLLEREH
jgi:geranylgeranyl diphosphate synthase, type II